MSIEEKSIPEGFTPDEKIVAAINMRLNEGLLSCADAFAIADNLDAPPITVGRTADALNVRLYRCQLGFFGYPGKQAWKTIDVAKLPVPEGLEAAVRSATNKQGQLSCFKAWKLATEFKIPRLQVGYVADQLQIKITPCQLGAF